MTEEQKEAIRAKVARMSKLECENAIKDCHDTLMVGAYPYSSPYATKLWFEIDECRTRVMQLTKW